MMIIVRSRQALKPVPYLQAHLAFQSWARRLLICVAWWHPCPLSWPSIRQGSLPMLKDYRSTMLLNIFFQHSQRVIHAWCLLLIFFSFFLPTLSGFWASFILDGHDRIGRAFFCWTHCSALVGHCVVQIWRYVQVKVDGIVVHHSHQGRDDQVDFEPRWKAVCDGIPKDVPESFGRIHSFEFPRGEVEEHSEVSCQQPPQRASSGPTSGHRDTRFGMLEIVGYPGIC